MEAIVYVIQIKELQGDRNVSRKRKYHFFFCSFRREQITKPTGDPKS